MNIGIGEGTIDVFHNLIDEIVSRVHGWVKLASIDEVTSNNIVMVFLASTPRMSVGWCVDLHYHPHSFQLGVINHLLHILRRICSSNFAVFTELGN